ncbi:hypothetical protein K432DRAFT_94512 [Lepidopterella palustris CBS 459.81]|uniref:Uncharacterized protein n=1 Tax=Lepidopterella palustris CBS 459.81 TaxID=1314670 RepID=A0A8E2EIU5_9PEZI|nr:hypothetical protein K432DRAFT_94512 [Lepidopterella palustris CBS 459.81]
MMPKVPSLSPPFPPASKKRLTTMLAVHASAFQLRSIHASSPAQTNGPAHGFFNTPVYSAHAPNQSSRNKER